MKTAWAYARFSSDHQREESIDAQLRAITDYCQRNGYILTNNTVMKQNPPQRTTGRNFSKCSVTWEPLPRTWSLCISLIGFPEIVTTAPFISAN